MLKTFVCLAASLFCVNSFAVELYCAGQKQRDPSQRGVKVDCSDRSEVIGHLGGAWRVLRENSIGGTMEDMCWKPYKKAKEIQLQFIIKLLFEFLIKHFMRGKSFRKKFLQR